MKLLPMPRKKAVHFQSCIVVDGEVGAMRSIRAIFIEKKLELNWEER